MLNNLFSSFDIKNFFFYSYLLLNLYYIIILSIKFKINKINLFWKLILNFSIININKNFFLIIVFLIIFFLNFFSLNVFIFNITSQFSFNLIIIFIFWLPILVLSITKKKNSFLIHILPYGTRNFLIPIIILIEILRFFIRPLTLFLRLSINIIAGHVLLSLLREIILNKNIIYILIIYIYILIKLLVRFIQSYIITTLLTLYIEEI